MTPTDKEYWERMRIRDEALETAAQLIESYCDSPMIVQVRGEEAAKAIRALQGEPYRLIESNDAELLYLINLLDRQAAQPESQLARFIEILRNKLQRERLRLQKEDEADE